MNPELYSICTNKASFVLSRHKSGYSIRDQRYKEDNLTEYVSRTDKKMLIDRVVYTYDLQNHIITKDNDLYIVELLYNTEKKLGEVNSVRCDLLFLRDVIRNKNKDISDKVLRKKLSSYLKSIKSSTITHCAFLKFNLELLTDEDSKHCSQVLGELIEDNDCNYNDIKIAQKVLLRGLVNY